MTSLDEDLKKKQAGKYDHEMEAQVVAWIEEVTGEKKGDMPVAEWLKNGKVLCAIPNAIEPGTIKKVNESAMPFKQMENITNFMNVARKWGVPESSMFGTPDLYEEKNMGSVIMCIYQFGGAVQVHCPDYAGPKLGLALKVGAKDAKRASAMATQAGGLTGTLEQKSAFTGARALGTDAANVQHHADGAGGLDADLKKKQDENHPTELEAEVVAWIEAVTGEKRGDLSTQEWLMDGKILCALVNKIEDGKIKKVNESTLAFKQMENITNFMNVAREWGVPEMAMFGTPDLYEGKNMGSVIKSLNNFGGAVQKSCPDYKGPKLGIMAVDIVDERRNLGMATDQNEAMSRAMEVERPVQAMKR